MDTYYESVVRENKIKFAFLEQQASVNRAKLNVLSQELVLVGRLIENLRRSRNCDYLELDKLHQKEAKLQAEIAGLSRHIFQTHLQLIEEKSLEKQAALDNLLASGALTRTDFYYTKGELQEAVVNTQIKLIRVRLSQLPAAEKGEREVLMQQETSLLKGEKISYS